VRKVNRAGTKLGGDKPESGRRGAARQHRGSFTAETHLGDALHALFYQPARFIRAGRLHIPNRRNGLLETMPILTPLVTSVPRSGYLAVVFLTLIESYPCAAFLPAMVEVASAWRGVHDVGANFWNEHQVGHRICEWIERCFKVIDTFRNGNGNWKCMRSAAISGAGERQGRSQSITFSGSALRSILPSRPLDLDAVAHSGGQDRPGSGPPKAWS
jgi:hypothetical protein